MRPILSILVFLTVMPLLAQVPRDGRTLVLRQNKGIQIVRFFGPDSVKGFFVGSGFNWVDSDEHNPDPTFWMNDVLVQWMHFTRQDINCKRHLKGQDLIEFFFRYETDYLKKITDVDVSELNIERFAFTSEPTSDGLRHHFLIWSATPHGGTAKQYWIATDHPSGLMVLSLIPRQSTDETRIKVLIDSYMANYGILAQQEAKACLVSLQAFEHQSLQNQVPSIKRQPSDKPGVETIAFPPAPGKSQP